MKVPPQANSKKRHTSRDMSLVSPEFRGLVNVIVVSPLDTVAATLDRSCCESSGGRKRPVANLGV